MKTLELLVVEDKEQHVADAKEFFAPREEAGIVSVDYVATLKEAQEATASKQYDGIISDIFFPMDVTDEEARREELSEMLADQNLDHRYVSAMKEWQEGRALAPAGVYVAKEARENGTPVVLCTDTYHHGASTEPVCRWSRRQQPTVEMVDTDSDGEPKNWRTAYAMTLWEMEGPRMSFGVLMDWADDELESLADVIKEKENQIAQDKAAGKEYRKNSHELMKELHNAQRIIEKYQI